MPATGPRTHAGKAVVSRNAARHGLYADPGIIVGTEQPGDWLAFHDAVVQSLAPEGAFEDALASRIAHTMWRLRRIPAAEAALEKRHAALAIAQEQSRGRSRVQLQRELGPDSFYGRDDGPEARVDLPPDPLPHAEALDTLIRLEAHLNRMLLHASHELEASQERRRGNAAPLARVDVHGMPGT